MTFKRKIYDELLNWKNTSNGNTAILIEGARRIGKTTIVREFVKNEYDDYLILDFAKEPTIVRNIFKENLDNLDNFFRELFITKGKELKGKRCAVVFDEIQLFPFARQSIKYLVEDGRYDYIETGSLISIKKNKEKIMIPSEEEKIKMYPMDFEEYLWAIGDNVTFNCIKEAYEKRKSLGDLMHNTVLKRFRTYMVVGGMPQAIDAYVKGKSYQEIDRVKRTILDLYEDDLSTYDEDNNEKASVVFKTIPEQLENKNSHFKFSLVEKNARYKNYIYAIKFIEDSMIGNECINVTEPEVALELFADRSNFKLYMGDTGLLVTQIMKSSKKTDDNIYSSLINDKLGINQGMILENMVAQMLRASGYNLFFHEYKYRPKDQEKEQKYEIDFMIVKDKKICPIEVKSSSYKSHKSFTYLKDKYKIKLDERYIIYTKDLKIEDNITYLPIYMTMFI